MIQRKDFTDEEWLTLQLGPWWVAQMIGLAEGTITKEEWGAVFNSVRGGFQGYTDEIYRGGVAEGLERWKADPRAPMDGLRQVAKLLDAKVGSSDARVYKVELFNAAVELAKISEPSAEGFTARESNALQGVLAVFGLDMEGWERLIGEVEREAGGNEDASSSTPSTPTDTVFKPLPPAPERRY